MLKSSQRQHVGNIWTAKEWSSRTRTHTESLIDFFMTRAVYRITCDYSTAREAIAPNETNRCDGSKVNVLRFVALPVAGAPDTMPPKVHAACGSSHPQRARSSVNCQAFARRDICFACRIMNVAID